MTVAALVVALVGYDLIHKAEQWLTYLMIVIFGIFTIALFVIHYPGGHLRPRPVQGHPVLRAVRRGRRLPDQLGDLRLRLLPLPAARRHVRKTFFWTYGGSAIGGAWMMIVGAVLAAWAGSSFDGTGIAGAATRSATTCSPASARSC